MRREQVGHSSSSIPSCLFLTPSFQAKLSFVSVLVDGDGMNVRRLLSDMPGLSILYLTDSTSVSFMGSSLKMGNRVAWKLHAS